MTQSESIPNVEVIPILIQEINMKVQKIYKPLCRLIMAVAIMMLSLQAMAFSYTYQGKTLYYNITSYSGNTVKVTEYSSDNYVSGDVVIPSTVRYNGTTYSVTSIGNYAFRNCSGLTSVTIPTGVTSIGNYAFRNCSGLTSVTIPTGVTSIGNEAFYNCSGLTSVTIPNSVTSIGDNAFRGCSGLTSVTIPNSVTFIGEDAFSGCTGLTTLNFNAIDCQDFEAYYDRNGNPYYPFSGTSLTTVNIGDSVQRIPANFVRGRSGLTSVSIPNSVTSIGGSAFENCRGLTSVSIPNSVTSIGYGAFSGCSGLTSVTIPNSVTSIGEFAFSGCSGLTSVSIPNSVTFIGKRAFYDCSGLITLNFNAINCQDFEAYRDNGTYYYPFSGTSLTTVNIGDNVQRIPANFVRGCSGLTSVTIPNSVTSIGDSAFYGCSGLTTLNFNAINCQDFSSDMNSYYPFSGTSLTTVNIGDSVQRIPAYFVFGRSGLTSVTIPNSVTSIGGGAFAYCRGLTSVSIGNSVTSIGGSAFENCRGLTSVSIGNSVTSIGYSAFSGCSGLTSVTIPNSVTSIGGCAFENCSSLTTLNFNAINCQDFEAIGLYYDGYIHNYYPFSGTSLTTVNVGDSIQRIPANFVRDCRGLTSVTIPNSVTEVGHDAFRNCEGLIVAIIGNGVSNVGNNAFKDCSYLTYLTIGIRLERIDDSAFANCSLLTSITSLASVPPLIVSSNVFAYPNNCTVTVPCGSLEAYTEQTNRWNLLFNGRISEGLSFGLSVSANDEAYGRVEVETQSCNVKTLTAIANEGYEFTAWNDGNTENPRTVSITSDTAFMAIFTASGSSSLQEVNAKEFALYPNPAKSFVTLEFETLEENTLLQILDINGRRVRTFDLKAGVENLRIDLGDLPKGVYTIMVGNATKKLIVE